jgi:hypothetical protein
LERLESLGRDELIQIILDLQRMIEQQRAEIEQLKRRGGASPFSGGTHKPDVPARCRQYPASPGHTLARAFLKTWGLRHFLLLFDVGLENLSAGANDDSIRLGVTAIACVPSGRPCAAEF